MSRLCSKIDPENQDNCYVKGYSLNYEGGSTASGSASNFMDMVFEKSIQMEDKSTQNLVNNSSVSAGTNKQTILDAREIKERCRIAYECRNNMVCIEGNRLPNKN